MAMWRCPHCGTPQAETARCWVCRRSSTACGSCRHFRRSIAAQLGYCGLDPRRSALRGEEIRGCWEAPAAAVVPGGPATVRPIAIAPRTDDDRTSVRRLEFVPVEAPASASSRPARPRGGSRKTAGRESPPPDAVSPASTAEPRWSLWGDLDG